MKFLLLLGVPVFVFGLTSHDDINDGENGENPNEEAIYAVDDILDDRDEFGSHGTTAASEKRLKRQVDREKPKWPNNTVYFFFDSSISENKRKIVYAATKYMESRTCINFIEDSSAPNRINITNWEIRCLSETIGMKGGVQIIAFSDYCQQEASLVHEFMHAMGVMHTYGRHDRSEHYKTDEDAQYLWDMFEPKLYPTRTYTNTPFEHGSVMQYPPSNEKQPIDTRYLHTMGGRFVSFYDIELLNTHYECHAKCSNYAHLPDCLNKGVRNPRNCSVCLCPSGFGGTLCGERPPGCGETFAASSEWKNKTIVSSGTEKMNEMYPCTNWITAPTGKRIEVRIISISSASCTTACNTNGLEIKTEDDIRITSPRICCKEDYNNTVFKSDHNPTPIVSYDRHTPNSTSVISYRYVSKTSPTTPSTTTTTTARTTTTISTTEEPIKPKIPAREECNDIKPDCKQRRGFCNIDSLFYSMKYECAKTCGFCGKTGQRCEDTMPDCAMDTYCNSPHMRPLLVESYCAKTCGYCEYPH